jgi:hypothetical protein
MITKKIPNPVEHLLASLDEGREIENFATDEIEALPIEEARQRLDELGIDTSLPGYIKSLTASNPSPAEKLLDALDDDVDQLSSEEIEQLTPEEVRTKLNSVGLNYLAGIYAIRKLTEAPPDGQPHARHSPQALSRRMWAGLKMAVIGSLPRRKGLLLPRLRTLLSGLWVPAAVPGGVGLALALCLGYFVFWPNASAPVSQMELASRRTPTAVSEPTASQLVMLTGSMPITPRSPSADLERTKPDTKPDIRGSVSTVESASRIKVGSQWLDLYGINDPTQGAHVLDVLGYLRPSRLVVECYQKDWGRYQCYADGKDLALLALRGGLAQAAADAPSEYRSIAHSPRAADFR